MKRLFLLSAITLLIGASSFTQPSALKHHRHHKHHKHHKQMMNHEGDHKDVDNMKK